MDVASIDNNSGSMKQKLNTIEIPNIEILHISNLTIDTWILYSFVSCKLPCLMHEMPPLLELLPFILIWKLHFLLFSKSNFKHWTLVFVLILTIPYIYSSSWIKQTLWWLQSYINIGEVISKHLGKLWFIFTTFYDDSKYDGPIYNSGHWVLFCPLNLNSYGKLLSYNAHQICNISLV